MWRLFLQPAVHEGTGSQNQYSRTERYSLWTAVVLRGCVSSLCSRTVWSGNCYSKTSRVFLTDVTLYTTITLTPVFSMCIMHIAICRMLINSLVGRVGGSQWVIFVYKRADGKWLVFVYVYNSDIYIYIHIHTYIHTRTHLTIVKRKINLF
jgi:hypothetical protein